MIRLLGQAPEDVVFEEAQVDLAPQLAAADIGQGRADSLERPPRLHFVMVEPLSVVVAGPNDGVDDHASSNPDDVG